MNGKLYGVSVGPGDPELITVKALRIIRECGIIAVPETDKGGTLALSAAEKAVDLSGKTILRLGLPMTHDRERLRVSREAAGAKIAYHLRNGEDVAMLNIGDISIYSTFSYIAGEVRKAGFETEVCAGVPSFCAAAAELGISLTKAHTPLVIIPAQYAGMNELLKTEGTKVIMKGGKKAAEIRDLLRETAGCEETYAVENCGLEGERIYTDISDVGDCGYFTVFIAKDGK